MDTAGFLEVAGGKVVLFMFSLIVVCTIQL